MTLWMASHREKKVLSSFIICGAECNKALSYDTQPISVTKHDSS